jgi:hypothetical protein
MLITCNMIFFIDSFALPRCAILDSPTIDKISTADRSGDATKREYGHLRVRFFFIIIFFFLCAKFTTIIYFCNHIFCS